MARFNKKAAEETVLNHEGEKAYTLNPKTELYTLVVTSLFSDKFYEATDDRVSRLRGLIKKVEPNFVAKLAIYAREKMYLRSMPLALVVELAKIHNGDDVVSRALKRVIARTDEITETLAYYASANNREDIKKLGKLSNQIKKGVADAFNRFDEYQFGKYDRDTEIKLRDALFLVHPKAKDDNQQKLFDKIVNGELKTPYTWETELSAKGNNKETWEALIDSGKVGYMALMRNLRNILNAGVSNEHAAKVANVLKDPEQVRRSKQFPFRFLSAYRELQRVDSPNTSKILNALEEAVKISAERIAGFGDDTTVAIACDVSGSMQRPISPNSTVQNYDIGLMLGMLLQHRCSSVVSGMFGDVFKIIQLPQSSILQNVVELHRREGEVGYSTNGHFVLIELLKKEIKADKIMMFTDNQMWNSYGTSDSMKTAWDAYKKFHPSAKLYLFDLAGYGTTPVSMQDKDVALIAGWSDKVFDVLESLESSRSALDHIEGIEL